MGREVAKTGLVEQNRVRPTRYESGERGKVMGMDTHDIMIKEKDIRGVRVRGGMIAE